MALYAVGWNAISVGAEIMQIRRIMCVLSTGGDLGRFNDNIITVNFRFARGTRKARSKFYEGDAQDM